MKFSVTEDMNKVLGEASSVARKYASPEIGTEHILYGMVRVSGSRAGILLASYGVDTGFETRVFTSHVALTAAPDYSNRVKNMFRTAMGVANDTGRTSVGSEHFLHAMLLDKTCVSSRVLREIYGVDISQMIKKLADVISNPELFDEQSGKIIRSSSDGRSATELPAQLTDMGVDITARARDGKIDPIIGRSEEIERIEQILCRKTKNNPVLVGEPGVGKSAVVEGLARAIVEGEVPDGLKGKTVFSLDVGSLVAGTKYRGALEEKLKAAIDIIRERGDIILFIDEIHTLAQAGSKEGEVSPADLLKPYLARGELQTVGATTLEEYRKYIEKDKALERRFQPVVVAPPSVDDTIEIIKGLRGNYEAFHKVRLGDDAIVAAAKLSDRYVPDRCLPDKAIDLIDEAMSKAKIGGVITPEQHALRDELERLKREENVAAQRGDYRAADEIHNRKLDVKRRLDLARGEVATIGAEQIAEIVSRWTGVPVTRLSASESERLMKFEEILHERVIGQDAAISAVSKAIRRARAGLKDPNRPIGSFLFLGPTGVGKTELTKAIGEALFDDGNAVIRIDMSEYMESHSVSKLIGAPPGYAGFDDGGQLTEAVRRKPYSVVLFDEIEKAHPDVYNLLLQTLDDGRLSDSQGRTVSFKNTVIIMTSNAGVSELKALPRLGFFSPEVEEKRREEALIENLKKYFKPEFLNRIDVTCVFRPLTKNEIGRIAGLMLDKFDKTLSERGISLEISPRALDYIVDAGYDAEFGARPLRRVIEQQVEDPIAEGIISGRIASGQTVRMDYDGMRLVLV